jgi:hypothetical protein
MGVVHDYKCSVHGYFENNEAKCHVPMCEGEVMLVFLQAPGMIGDKTKSADRSLNQLAMDFNMTNIKSAKSGESQAGYYTRKNTQPTAPVESAPVQREARPGDAAIWGKGLGGLNMKSILSGRAVQSIRGEPVGINPKDAGNLTGPRTASFTADHQGLKIDK